MNVSKHILGGFGDLLPARLINPGGLSSVGHDLRVGVLGIDDKVENDILVNPKELQTTLPVALAQWQNQHRKDQILIVRLSAAFFLEMNHALPMRSKADIEAALTLYLTQNTPLNLTEIVWRSQTHPQSGNVVTVRQYIINSYVLDEIRVGIEAAGFKVKEIWLKGSNLNFLDNSREVFRTHFFWRRLSFAALILAAFVSSISIYINYQRRELTLAQIEAEIGSLGDHAVALRQDVSVRQESELRIIELANKLRADRQALEVLSALTELIPDGTWLTQLSITRGNVRIAGFTDVAPSSLIIELEQSPLFSEVRLSGPVVRDQRLEQDRFEMALALAGRDE